MNVSAQSPVSASTAPYVANSASHERAVVELRRVSKSYTRGSQTVRVVDKVDLLVQHGQIVLVLGPSGSGKTTLLSIIGCVLTSDEGTVSILGLNVGRLSRDQSAELRRKHIGFVFQRFHLLRGLSAAENVAMPLTLDGWKPAPAARRAAELLHLVDMRELAAAYPHQLSVGQCQRVAFARALAADPELILADEPTASLDAQTGQQAMELLRRLTKQSGKTAIVVTHDPRILKFADRIVQMENGTLVEGRTDEVSLPADLPGDRELVAAGHRRRSIVDEPKGTP